MSETNRMSDTAGKAGPTLQQTVSEVQGRFPTDDAMQDALGRLTIAGYDRADFSLPDDQADTASSTPTEGAENPIDHIDQVQMRTMGTGMAGYAGAVAAAGATLATGGAAAVAIAAAAAVGAGSALVANAAGHTADKLAIDERNRKGAEGRLILAVRTRSEAQVAEVTNLMQQSGATAVEAISREAEMLTRGVSAASWTGG